MTKSKPELEISVSEVVDYLKIMGAYYPALREVVTRRITAEAARKSGLSVSDSELQKAADAFRAAHGLYSAKETEKWLSRMGLSLEAFENLIGTNMLINKFKDRLEKKAGKAKYHSLPGIKETVREMVYQDWVNQNVT